MRYGLWNSNIPCTTCWLKYSPCLFRKDTAQCNLSVKQRWATKFLHIVSMCSSMTRGPFLDFSFWGTLKHEKYFSRSFMSRLSKFLLFIGMPGLLLDLRSWSTVVLKTNITSESLRMPVESVQEHEYQRCCSRLSHVSEKGCLYWISRFPCGLVH